MGVPQMGIPGGKILLFKSKQTKFHYNQVDLS